MSTITINKLIKQGEELKLSLIPIPNPTFNTHTWQSNENRSTYNEWSILVTRFLEQNYPGDLCNQKWTSELRNFSLMLTLDTFNRMLSILKSCHKITNIVKNQGDITTNSLGQTITMIQNNNQHITLNIMPVLEDVLNPEQINELKEYLKRIKDQSIEEKRKGIGEKLLKFGTDIATNIVANLLIKTFL